MWPGRSRAPFLSGCNHCHSEGGKSGHNFGGFGFVGPVFRGVSFKNHWRLISKVDCPRPLSSNPLYTTFDHILRLTGLLSTAKFQVETLGRTPIRKARDFAVNGSDDHKE